MNISCIGKILFLRIGAYRSSWLCWLLNLEYLTIFELTSTISFKYMMPFWCPFIDPHLTTRLSNIGV